MHPLYLTGIPFAIGVGAAAGLTRLVAAMLYRVNPRDPAIFVVVAAILGVISWADVFGQRDPLRMSLQIC